MPQELMQIEEVPAKFGLAQSRVDQINSVFLPMMQTLKEQEDAFNAIAAEAKESITADVCKRAKRLRINIGNVRIAVEKARVAEKAEYLQAGKAIDGIANIHKFTVSNKEEQLKAIEDHFENLEREQRAKVAAQREEELALHGMTETSHLNLGDMDAAIYVTFLAGAKLAHETRLAAEAKMEAERIAKEKADAEERERVAKENAALKAAAEADRKKQEAEAAERKRIEDERIAKEKAEQAKRNRIEDARIAKEKAEQAARDEALRIEREAAAKKQADIEAKLAAEQAERKRIEDDKRKQEEEIQRAKEAAGAAERKAKEELEQADDRQKIAVFVQALRDLYKTIPKLNDKKLEKQLQDKITEISGLCK
jgi:hypothetical protein